MQLVKQEHWAGVGCLSVYLFIIYHLSIYHRSTIYHLSIQFITYPSPTCLIYHLPIPNLSIIYHFYLLSTSLYHLLSTSLFLCIYLYLSL